MPETQWFYSSDGGQAGPLNDVQLKALAASGQLKPNDLVWRDGLADWKPAATVPGLFDAVPVAAPTAPSLQSRPAVAAPRTPSSVLPYIGGGDTNASISARTVDLLSRTRPWVLLMSIITFIGCGLYAIVGLGTMFLGLAATSRAPVFGAFPAFMGCFYFLGALLYFFPAMYLYRYAAGIAQLRAGGRIDDLETALDAQRAFWKFVGILTAIAIGFVALMFLLIFGAGVMLR